MSSSAIAQATSHYTEGDPADKLFWLSRSDEAIPRGSVVADLKRSAGVRHVYQSIPFALDTGVARRFRHCFVRYVGDIVAGEISAGRRIRHRLADRGEGAQGGSGSPNARR